MPPAGPCRGPAPCLEEVNPVPQHGKLSFLYERVKASITSEKTVVLIRETSPTNRWFILINETSVAQRAGCPDPVGNVLPWCKLFYAPPAAQDPAQKWDKPGSWLTRLTGSEQSMGGLQAVPKNFASHILPQSCPRGDVSKVLPDVDGMRPVCYQVSLGWCKEQCETYASDDTQLCCDVDSPKDATDFFNRPCRNPVPSDVSKLR